METLRNIQHGPDTIDTVTLSDSQSIQDGLSSLPNTLDELSKLDGLAELSKNTHIGEALFPMVTKLTEGGRKWQADQLIKLVDRRLRNYANDYRGNVAYEKIHNELSTFILAIVIEDPDDAGFADALWDAKIEQIIENRAINEEKKRVAKAEAEQRLKAGEEKRAEENARAEALRQEIRKIQEAIEASPKHRQPSQLALSAMQAGSNNKVKPPKLSRRAKKKLVKDTSSQTERNEKDENLNGDRPSEKRPTKRSIKKQAKIIKKSVNKSANPPKNAHHRSAMANGVSRMQRVISKKSGPSKGSGHRGYKYKSNLGY